MISNGFNLKIKEKTKKKAFNDGKIPTMGVIPTGQCRAKRRTNCQNFRQIVYGITSSEFRIPYRNPPLNINMVPFLF